MPDFFILDTSGRFVILDISGRSVTVRNFKKDNQWQIYL